MLRQGAAALRSDQRFRGLLGRIEGNEVVVIGIGAEAGASDEIANVHIGRRTPLDKRWCRDHRHPSMERSLGPGHGAPGTRVARLAVRHHDPIYRRRIAVLVDSDRPNRRPIFDAEDTAYIDVLASSFANQFQVTNLEGSLREEEERHGSTSSGSKRCKASSTNRACDIRNCSGHVGSSRSLHPARSELPRSPLVHRGADLTIEAEASRGPFSATSRRSAPRYRSHRP